MIFNGDYGRVHVDKDGYIRMIILKLKLAWIMVAMMMLGTMSGNRVWLALSPRGLARCEAFRADLNLRWSEASDDSDEVDDEEEEKKDDE